MPTSTPVDDRPADAIEPEEPGGPAGEGYPEGATPEPLDDVGMVDEQAVADFLANVGGIANWLLPTPEWAPEAWLMTEGELASIAGPLTRIANARAPAVAAMVTERSDEVAVVVQLGRYVKRNIGQIRPPEEGETPATPIFPQAGVTLDEHGNVIEPAEPVCPQCFGTPPDHAPDCPAAVVGAGDETRPYFEQGAQL